MEPIKVERREPVSIYRKRQGIQPWKQIRPATVVKYIALTLAGILLFRVGQAYALAERGYEALGGEVLALSLPVMYYLISRIVRDFRQG